MPEAQLLAPADPRWSAFLAEAPHDFYHLPAYAEVTATWDRGLAAACHVETANVALLVPLVVREIPGHPERRDAVSPYGYASPLFSRCAPADQVHALEAFADAGVGAGLVSSFLRLHPLLDHLPTGRFLDGRLHVRDAGKTLAVDLTLPADAWRQKVRSGHRQDIAKLRKAGFRFQLDDWSWFGPFIVIYGETMGRLGAAAGYRFDASYFADLRRALGDRLHLACVVGPDGALAAAALFVRCGPIVQYHLSATADAFTRQAPGKLMIEQMVAWSREQGARWLHLGGGLGGREDSLFQFKRGFTDVELAFQTATVIHDQDAYDALVKARVDLQAGGAASDGYFPRYRAPEQPIAPPLAER